MAAINEEASQIEQNAKSNKLISAQENISKLAAATSEAVALIEGQAKRL
ncbi:hypothetical protein N9L49_05240 [Rhodospirillales bacterium]|nr:hypothetical protein [Rhodospirillales bacterium]